MSRRNKINKNLRQCEGTQPATLNRNIVHMGYFEGRREKKIIEGENVFITMTASRR